MINTTSQMTRAAFVSVLCLIGLLLAACSSSEDTSSAPTILGAGDVQVDLSDEQVDQSSSSDAVEPAVATADEEAGAAVDGAAIASDEAGEPTADDATSGEQQNAPDDDDADDDDEDDDAIPLNEQDDDFVEQTGEIFDTIDLFNQCLRNEGYEFLGVPEQGMTEDDPRADPTYIQALTSCAAETNIQETLQSADLGSDGLSTEEIEARNAGYVYFEECLTVRGWTLAEAIPDQNGLLQTGPDGFEPPPGETLVGTDDLRECLAVAAAEVEAQTEAEQ